MSWFTQTLENWISFPYLQEYLMSVLHPLWLLKLLLLIYSQVICVCMFFLVVTFGLHICKLVKNPKKGDVSKFMEKSRESIIEAVDKFGKIWHGYEVIGIEHLCNGPAIIVYYHAVSTIDYSLLVARLSKEKQRKCFSIIDHAIYNLPGLKLLFDLIRLKDFGKSECVEILKKGDLLGIAPGGGREGNFSHDYNIMWGKRTGFAQIALEAKVPIIPIFTQNACETYRNIGKTRFIKWLYEKTRIIYLPFFGGAPVKLRTFIGEPIPYDPNITAVELAEKAKVAIENLRDKHQKRPGSMLRALLERFDKHHKAN